MYSYDNHPTYILFTYSISQQDIAYTCSDPASLSDPRFPHWGYIILSHQYVNKDNAIWGLQLELEPLDEFDFIYDKIR